MHKLLHHSLQKALSLPFGTDWNSREEYFFTSLLAVPEFSGILKEDVFLGGDRLRPYVTVRERGQFWVTALERPSLSVPRLINELSSGKFGMPKVVDSDPPFTTFVISNTPALSLRMTVSRAYLTTLTNSSRYQSRRYPLNVGRLGQWLRFQHVARARVTDLALTFEGDLSRLVADIGQSAPQVVGVSLNFGELDSLREFVRLLRNSAFEPTVLCVGNVLAAWAQDEVRRICSEFQLIISESYGELLLEHLCGSSFSGSSGVGQNLPSLPVRGITTHPEAIVFPDEQLLAETINTRGQPSIETSFGCQYSRCSFCPRDHRSKGWRRPAIKDSTAVVAAIAQELIRNEGSHDTILSIVDEDAFGSEGTDPSLPKISVIDLVMSAGRYGIACEIYARAEQLFNVLWPRKASITRLSQLSIIQPHIARLFVGVESGSDSQLTRYSKGQTVQDVIYALRAGSLLGLPLEFGFITFDPLTTTRELAENIRFLARTDVLLPKNYDATPEQIYEHIVRPGMRTNADPVFMRVAYMATELEVFAKSPIAAVLRNRRPDLMTRYDESFARFECRYAEPAVAQAASWCRVWTEATFRPIYRIRLQSRSNRHMNDSRHRLIRRYREATFALLLATCKEVTGEHDFQCGRVADVVNCDALECVAKGDLDVCQLQLLWSWVVSGSELADVEDARFSLTNLERRRDT